MTGNELYKTRKQSNKTQDEAARELGVSQTYLSLLEKGRRPVTPALVVRAARAFELSPLQLPLSANFLEAVPVSDDQMAAELSALGYPGFSHIKPATARNPAEILASALNANNRDARLVEALPWILLEYPNLDWENLIKAAKLNDLQNRLGFMVSVALGSAEFREEKRVAVLLSKKIELLETSRLVREGTLCRDSMLEAEKRWLKEHRSTGARHWFLLTDLTAESMNYYA